VLGLQVYGTTSGCEFHLYILDINPLLDEQLAKIFCHSVGTDTAFNYSATLLRNAAYKFTIIIFCCALFLETL
jgi:hypothetical protein